MSVSLNVHVKLLKTLSSKTKQTNKNEHVDGVANSVQRAAKNRTKLFLILSNFKFSRNSFLKYENRNYRLRHFGCWFGLAFK
jgi:hypothetical protein